MRVRVKFCGMTRGEDVAAAAELGVDAVGLVFHPGSPRRIGIEQAQGLVRDLPPFLTVTALFLDPEAELVRQVLERLHVGLLQFHGAETPEFCRGFGRPYIKAVPMGSGVDLAEYARRYHDATALLLDSHAAGGQGGTGRSFDWSAVAKPAGVPLILAGGLKPGNVAAAVRLVQPYGVDVSSGVERAPGIKDRDKMTAFMREVNGVASA